MNEIFGIVIATIIVLAVGIPIVCLLDKWIKEMGEQDNNDK